MDTALKNAAILANLSALRMTLAGALERAKTRKTPSGKARSIRPSARPIGIDTMLQDATAFYGAALALHRSGRP